MRITATFSNPSSAGAYTAGDAIANSATGSAVVPMTFDMAVPDGRLIGCSCVVTPATSNLVITACDFDLLLFRPVSGIPFAAGSFPGDNAAMSISAAAMRELVGVFSFANTAWRNPLGALTAGITGYQAVAPTARTEYAFNASGTSQTLIGVVQAKAAWTPGAVINQFDFALEYGF
jgi:hypothetical protein